MKFAVCNEIFGKKKWAEVCRFAAGAGFEGLEIAPCAFAGKVTDISAKERRAIRKAAEAEKVEIVCLHMLMSPPALGLRINSADAAARRTAVEYLKEILRFAEELGAPKLVYGSPFTRNPEPGVSYRQAREYMKESLLQSLEDAARRKLTLCLEPLPADCTDLFTTVESAYNFVAEVGHPNFGLMVDCKAMSTEARPIEKTIRLFGPWIQHVHANDAGGGAPGFGRVDFKPILAALKEAGYQGWVSLEPFHYPPDAETVVPVSLKYLKSCLAS
jgi:sugar phosphate isomerase/epimerase